MNSHCASKVFSKRKMSMDGVIVWRFLFCGIFCWIKREFTSFKVWSWSALPRLAQGTPSASTNALWLVIFGTLRKIFTCNTFLLQNPMARHRQRCLRHTMDFGVRSFSPSGSLYSLIWSLWEREEYLLPLWTLTLYIDIKRPWKMNSLPIDKLKNVKMTTWCIGWLTSNIRMPLVLAATVQTAFAGWIPIINIIIIIILVFLWEDDFIKT